MSDADAVTDCYSVGGWFDQRQHNPEPANRHDFAWRSDCSGHFFGFGGAPIRGPDKTTSRIAGSTNQRSVAGKTDFILTRSCNPFFRLLSP
jgi:hypothetical protein